VEAEALRPHLPPGLELEEAEGGAWLGVIPFRIEGFRARGVRRTLPWLGRFPELNVRTYVTHAGKPGVYFFSLDAASRAAAWAARATYHLPYFHARMSSVNQNGWIHYYSVRDLTAELKAKFRPSTPAQLRNPGTIEHWLTERYCLYTTHKNSIYRAEIHHEPWPLHDAECEFSINSMAASAGIQLPTIQPLLHFAKRLEVLIWPLKKA